MSNNFHTPLVTTEKIPANGATINAPLGQIDQALTNQSTALGAAQGDIATLESDMSTAQADIVQLDGEVAAAVQRANHTGTQAPGTIAPQGAGSGLDADTLRGLTPAQIASSVKGSVSKAAAQLARTAADGYLIGAGSADINGVIRTWDAIARTGLTLTPNTVYYVYLYDSAGNIVAEEVADYPNWDETLNYFIKPGDSTRRWVGWFATNPAGEIRNFLNICNGRESETIFIDGQDGTDEKRVLSFGNRSDQWTIFYMTALVPHYATHWLAAPNLQLTDALNDAILGLSPIDLGAALADEAPYHIQARSQVASGFVSPGAMWLLMPPTPEYYYRIKNVVGSNSAGRVEAHGARIVR